MRGLFYGRKTHQLSTVAKAHPRLCAAAALRAPGPYQVQAAIQAVHSARKPATAPDGAAIVGPCDMLLALAPSIGACVSRAAVLAEWRGGSIALEALALVPPDRAHNHQPYWAMTAHAFALAGQAGAAKAAYTKAIGLIKDAAVRRFLQQRSNAL